MDLFLQSNLFKLPVDAHVDPNSSNQQSEATASNESADPPLCNNPQSMAERFGVPYLGKLPMDPNILRACEEGKSFIDAYPSSVAAAPFAEIVQKIVQQTASREEK
jgi:MinD-like ATPase involved in chromosome partitioning or flagellar assembly